MADFQLTSRPVLGGLDTEIGATTLREILGARLITISIPQGGEAAMRAALPARLGCALPAVGASARSTTIGAQVLRLGADRIMLVQLPGTGDHRAPDLPGYPVEQSDAWVMLELAGPLGIAALERSCRLDLDSSGFNPGGVARTKIETVSTILLRRDLDRWLLLAPRSYAEALCHTLTTSLRYVV